jgi:hypothetical protein
VVTFIGPVAPGGGGTLILSGSPRLVIQQDRRLSPSQRSELGGSTSERFGRQHPWLMALTGQAPSPAGLPPSWTPRPSSMACPCGWSS